MADYTELYDLLSNTVLRNKIEMAVSEAVRLIQSGEDTAAPFSQSTTPVDFPAQRRKFARRVIGGEAVEARKMLPLILMANKSATQAQILNASDEAIQANVNAIIDLLAEGEA